MAAAAETAGSIAARTFTETDQQWFAGLSGDINPMHMDSVAARRTVVGAPVVHGMHTLLWTLDQVSRGHLLPAAPTALQIRFGKPVYVGDTVTLRFGSRSDRDVTIKATVEGIVTATIKLGLDPDRRVGAMAPTPFEGPLHPPVHPVDLGLPEVEGRSGTVRFAVGLGAFCHAFPGAAELVGAHRVRGLAALSRLVGMDCPGLHSIFASIRVAVTDEPDREIAYRVESVDPRFRLLKMSIDGAGLRGRIEAFLRPEPTRQLSALAAAELVAERPYEGHNALIVGGSRGLGELTAKLVAGGGGAVTITYVVGELDAVAVAAEIQAAGGSAATRRYDASAPAAAQLEGLGSVTHVYYFATPRIAGSRSRLFDATAFEAYARIYVMGFHDLVTALSEHGSGKLRAFFPSTVFVDERPEEFGEYIAAKAAGEALCAHLTQHAAGITAFAPRLPRVLTDQTASLTPVSTTPAIDVMRPLVEEIQLGSSKPATP